MAPQNKPISEYGRLAVPSLLLAGTSFLLLVLSNYFYRGFPPPSEIYVIALGVCLAALGMILGLFCRRIVRLLALLIFFVNLLGWALLILGAYM